MSLKRDLARKLKFIRFEGTEEVLPPTVIPGEPVAWQRPRPRRGGNGFITPTEVIVYERLVHQVVSLQPAMRGGREPDGLGLYRVDVTFRIVEHPGDIDNLTKSILDGLAGALYVNDSQVHGLRVEIVQATENPFTMISAHRIGSRSTPLLDQSKKGAV